MRRIVWVLLSCLVVLALVLASCGPAADEEEVVTPPGEEEVAPPEKEQAVTEEKEMVTDALGRLVEKPRYGGTFVITYAAGPLVWDERLGPAQSRGWLSPGNETLLVGDWTRGPSGTGEASFLYDDMPRQEHFVGQLAESWEIDAENDTVTFHIRKGVHWHNKPPVYGRELTAYDVASTFINQWNAPMSYTAGSFPAAKFLADPDPAKAITATDKWTVVVKAAPGMLGEVWITTTSYMYIVPPELKEEYGDDIRWSHVCGTGPFFLKDYVADSSILWERNPNYWGKHPLYPQDTMPYLDNVKILIIPDYSTRITALRVGKVDWSQLAWEDAESVIKTNPELIYNKWNPGSGLAMHFRIDNPSSPCYDIRVRQALCMAVDNKEIADTLLGGDADLLNWPVAPLKEFMDMYTPLEELPETVREEFEYHPEKAKQLLAEAGYPDGFKTETYTTTANVDLLSAVNAYWEKIGVELDIKVAEYSIYIGVGIRKSFDDMFIYNLIGYVPFRVPHVLPGHVLNFSGIKDPYIDEMYAKIIGNYFDEPVRRQAVKELALWELQQCIMLQFPIGKNYIFWQPWVKSYNGERMLGKNNLGQYVNYIWLDQELKQ